MAVIVNLRGLKDLQKRLPKFTNKLVKKVAKRTPINIIAGILRGQQGLNDKKTLPKNTLSTINRKRSRGRPAASLIDDRVLINPNTWIVKKSGRKWIVKVKESRREAAFHLHEGIKSSRGKRKYRFMLKFKKQVPSWMAQIIASETLKFFRRYV